jgi:hypothetical protein
VLGFFAGGAVAAPGLGGGGQDRLQWQAQGEDLEPFVPGITRLGQDIGSWAAANVGLIVALVALAVVFGLAMMVVSLIAQGGMSGATVDLASGRGSSPGRAWGTGLRLFWRYAGLWLLLFVLAATAVVVVAVAVAALVALANIGNAGIIAAVAVGLLLAVPLVLCAIALAIAASIVVAYAQRAIFAEDMGPADALGFGVRLLRQHLGKSVLVWLVNLALSIGAGIAAGLVMLAALFVLGVPAAGLWAMAGLTAPTVGYVVGAGIALLAAGLVVGGIANTFLWHYWTLAYLQLTGRRDALTAA